MHSFIHQVLFFCTFYVQFIWKILLTGKVPGVLSLYYANTQTCSHDDFALVGVPIENAREGQGGLDNCAGPEARKGSINLP